MKKGTRVADVKPYGIYSCYELTPLKEAARKMVTEDISSVVIVNEAGFLRGILTRTDLVRAYLESENWAELPIKEYMSSEVVTVSGRDTLIKVAKLLQDKHIHRVVVVKEEDGEKRPVAVVSDSDLIQHMVE